MAESLKGAWLTEYGWVITDMKTLKLDVLKFGSVPIRPVGIT